MKKLPSQGLLLSRHSEEFKELEKVWYEKLKEEGFEDIENLSVESRTLKTWSNRFHIDKKYQADLEIAQQIYYEQARALIETETFYNEGWKKIWELHSEGMPEREIAKLVPYKKSMVHYVIHKTSKRIKRD